MSDLLRMDGKVAVVTGGAQGIGRAIAERFAEQGAIVVIADIDPKAGANTAREVQDQFHSDVHAYELDVTQEAASQQLAKTIVEKLGRIDVWINNAGVFPRLDPLDVPVDEFERIFRINVLGMQLGAQAAASHMIAASRPGVIINIASTAAFRGAGPYSGSKWAVRGMTQGLAESLGKHSIRIVAIAPTVTETPGIAEWRSEGTGPFIGTVIERIPLGRPGQPDDVARTAVFLASDAADFITGSTIVVDGGSLAVI